MSHQDPRSTYMRFSLYGALLFILCGLIYQAVKWLIGKL
jgi:hypothetical protein